MKRSKLGKRIKELRIASGFTQKKLAERIGLSEWALLRIEKHGARASEAEVFCSIARALDVSLDYLMGGLK